MLKLHLPFTFFEDLKNLNEVNLNGLVALLLGIGRVFHMIDIRFVTGILIGDAHLFTILYFDTIEDLIWIEVFSN